MSDSETLSWLRDLVKHREIIFVVGRPWDRCEWIPFVAPQTVTTQGKLKIAILKARTDHRRDHYE